jgi:hypothetical protein
VNIKNKATQSTQLQRVGEPSRQINRNVLRLTRGSFARPLTRPKIEPASGGVDRKTRDELVWIQPIGRMIAQGRFPDIQTPVVSLKTKVGGHASRREQSSITREANLINNSHVGA